MITFLEFLTESHHFPIFCGHWFNASGDIKYLIFYVTLLNQLIEGSCNFLSGSSSWYVLTLPSLVTIGIVVVEI